MRLLTVSLVLLVIPAPAAADWTEPVTAGAGPVGSPLTLAPGSGARLHLAWLATRTQGRLATAPGTVRALRLRRPWTQIALDGRGRAMTVTVVNAGGRCRGTVRRPIRLEVRRYDARGRVLGRVQRVGDECKNARDVRLLVNRSGHALLVWGGSPARLGGPQRIFLATGAVGRGLRSAGAVGGRTGAGAPAAAMNASGDAVVALIRGTRLRVISRTGYGEFGPARDAGPAGEAAVAIDGSGAAVVAWSQSCTCGETGPFGAPGAVGATARAHRTSPFGPPEILDTGVLTRPGSPVAAIASPHGAVVAWRVADGPLRASVAAAGQPFGAKRDFPSTADMSVGVDPGGPHLAYVHESGAGIVAVGLTSQAPPVRISPEGLQPAFGLTPQGRLALAFNDGSVKVARQR